MTLPSRERLTRAQFSLLKGGKGRRARGAALNVEYIPSPTLLVGVVVSKKVAKTAVARNRIRRRIYGIFEAMRPNLRGGTFVVVVQRAAVAASYKELEVELQELLKTLLLR